MPQKPTARISRAPLKALLPDYRDIEASVDNVIRSLFGLPLAHSPEVKHADLVMLATERRDLGIDDGDKWDILDASRRLMSLSSILLTHPGAPIVHCPI
ncbi:Uncharacterised protein [Serratia liquefaciens]|nr:Uncharacterised protein [Serratia liquefaciens]